MVSLKALPEIIPVYVLGFGAFLLMLKNMEAERIAALEKNRIQSEMKVACKVQKSFLPFKEYESDNLSAAGGLSDYDLVNGEFYDFFARDNKFAFIVGKVSANKAVAALGMVLTKSLFSFRAFSGELSSALILENMNKVLYDYYANRDFAVQAFVGVYDCGTKVLSYDNAAQECPRVYKKDGRIEYITEKYDRALSKTSQMIFKDKEFNTENGDCLIFSGGIKVNDILEVYGGRDVLRKGAENLRAADILHEELEMLQKSMNKKEKPKNAAVLVLCV